MHIYKRLDLLIASFLINILGLSIPLYVIHAINRYLSNGSMDTLIFSTISVLVAVGLEFLIRKYRKFIIININNNNFKSIHDFEGKYIYINKNIEDELRDIRSLSNKYDFNIQISLLDVPYIILFAIVIYLLSPLIFFLYIFLTLIILVISFFHKVRQNRTTKSLNNLRGEYINYENDFKSNFINFNINSIYYEAINYLKRKQEKIFNEKNLIDTNVYDYETLNSLLLNILIIFVVFISLVEVNEGDMQISSLIALNILVVRALLPVKLIPNIFFYKNIYEKKIDIDKKLNINKISIKDLLPINNITLNKLTIINPKTNTHLFNQFSINFSKGTTTVITGENGSGKSTLFNTICGALIPLNGNIMVNKINIDRMEQQKIIQLSSIIPQNPIFSSTTLFEYLKSIKKDIDSKTIEDLLAKCNLNSFFYDFNEGINLNLKENEKLMSLGIKKRIALAQVFYKNSEIIIFDEPTEGCDKITCQAFYNFINEKILQNKIIIIFTKDPFLIHGANYVVELIKGKNPIFLKK